jgi:hypothetical protein
MQDYSIDIQAEKIYASTTRDYFKEVSRSYYGENYRATIVTLYSVVIYDIVNKLEVLRDAYGDTKADSILKRIEQIQISKPQSPEWETELIKIIKKETKLLDSAEALHIDNLQLLRHLCAHPVRNSNYELFSPNKETVRAHLRNMLESVLTKRPLSTKNIFDEFIVDISAAKFRLLANHDVLDRYLTSKYLENLSLEAVKQIFKKLWKFTFQLESADADKNREINSVVLNYLLNKYFDQIMPLIRNEPDYYSNINIKHDYQISLLINNRHEVFNALRQSEQDLLLSRINSYADIHAYSWFANKTIEAHTELLQSEDYIYNTLNFSGHYIEVQTLVYLENILRNINQSKANAFVANMYRKSLSYDTAAERFNYLISPNLKYFSKDEFILLLNNIEANSQTYDHRDAVRDNNIIKKAIENRYSGQIDYSLFPNFNRRSN